MTKNKRSIAIGNRKIGVNHPPFIVAEMSANHNQELDKALRIVDAAAQAGVHALKLQTYTADTMTIRSDTGSFLIDDSNSLWQGQNLHDLYKQASTPWEWHEPIFKRCKKLGLIAFSSVFDETSLEFLEKLSTPVYKIASFENNHLPLIREVAATGKPMLISTGMATIEELDETVKTARDAGCEELILLKCTSSYPASPKETNLVTIPDLKEHFGTEVGLSDHTMGIGVSIAGVSLGATVIEKHFTLSRVDRGVDSEFSMEPHEMKLLVDESLKAWQAMGKVSYGPTETEKHTTIYRRSVYAVKKIDKGGIFTKENIRVIRPGDGLKPKYYDSILGTKATRNIKKGTPLDWTLIK